MKSIVLCMSSLLMWVPPQSVRYWNNQPSIHLIAHMSTYRQEAPNRVNRDHLDSSVLIDYELEPRVGVAERGFDLIGSMCAAKDETQVTRPLRWRQQLLRYVSADDYVFNVGHTLRRVN